MTAAWLAHLLTASGVVFAFLAARSVVEHAYRDAFFWLFLQVLVDAVDGVVARAARVSARIPWFDGAKLDDIVDYLGYVFVPALLVWRAGLVPEAWTTLVAGAMLLSSAYGFNRADAKTGDYFFTGFPSYWNIVVFYLLVLGWPLWANGSLLLLLAVLVFVPIRYLYPSRTPVLRPLTVTLGSIWGLLFLLMIWQYPAISSGILVASFVFPIYYFGLSFGLSARSGHTGPKGSASSSRGSSHIMKP